MPLQQIITNATGVTTPPRTSSLTHLVPPSSSHQTRGHQATRQAAGTIQEPFRSCTLPFATPFHNQIPLYTPSRHAHDIHEAEALAKLALGTVSNVLALEVVFVFLTLPDPIPELHSPIDITLQSTFQRLVAVAGSREFLPLAAKVRHYLSSVSLKRREWCSDFCINPYVGSSGEGLYGKMARDGMTCGGTYIVPPAILHGINVEHRCIVDTLRALSSDSAVADNPVGDAADPAAGNIVPDTNNETLQQQSNTGHVQLSQQQMASLCKESRPCCSVDTSVLEMLGAPDTVTATTEPEPDRIPHWMNPFYANRYENAYYKMQCELQAARTMEQNQLRFQLQQQRQLQHSMHFEYFYQSQQQQQQRSVLEAGSVHHKRVNADGATSPTPTKKVKLQPTALNKTKSVDKLSSSIHKVETKVETEDVQQTKAARESISGEVATSQDEGVSRASSNSGLNSENMVVSLGDGRAVARAAEN
ncbi:hypothetical protein CcCBS67573_g10315 [Chytriomyces confervae]|uniref:Uncharacterized protein n=1 Tax=Chytriomyces confervae TaxID=246404 RepID=A0A507D574_9FUNG|nr:hypothetical protein CcCBS67573_g10315 [Chytriomyces confervae]